MNWRITGTSGFVSGVVMGCACGCGGFTLGCSKADCGLVGHGGWAWVQSVKFQASDVNFSGSNVRLLWKDLMSRHFGRLKLQIDPHEEPITVREYRLLRASSRRNY